LPANLSPQAKGLWNRAVQARTVEEKIKLLQEFLSVVPKHKGNERLRAQVRRKIATLKLEVAEQRKRRTSRGNGDWFIRREGAAQVVLIGQTNAGRSSLLSALTRANPTVASHEFTTTLPVPGIMKFEDLRIQLVEAPAIVKGAADGVGWGSQALGLARNADGLMIVLDLSKDPQKQLRTVLQELDNVKISPRRIESQVQVTRLKGGSGIRVTVSGRLVDCRIEDIHRLLNEYGVKSAMVWARGEARLDDVEDALLESTTTFKPTIVVANKLDLPGARENLEGLRLVAADLPVIPTSCVTGENIQRIGRAVFESLRIIRVYTKEPNENLRSAEPFVMPEGSTVGDLAKRIHTELHDGFRFARVWGSTAKYPGEKVGQGHVLADKDVVEVHAK
jgi:ribosome-interacting GTPase 1